MTWSCGGFEQRSNVKRKRASEEETENPDFDHSRRLKRTSFSRLPFRTSPTISQTNTWQNAATPFQRPLTPVDSSDDEAHGQADNIWVRRHASTSPARPTLSNYRIPSVTIEPDLVDDEMDIGSTTPPPISRHVAPVSNRQIHLLSAPTISLDERVPTPISASFNLSENPSKGRRCRAPVRHTMLSPTLAEEPYLPSPVEPHEVFMDADPETMMRMDHASDGFGALSVDCRDDDMMQDDAMHPEHVMRQSHSQGGGKGTGMRNARLHMGFRADCEKCQQRVPGHYSHILWS